MFINDNWIYLTIVLYFLSRQNFQLEIYTLELREIVQKFFLFYASEGKFSFLGIILERFLMPSTLQKIKKNYNICAVLLESGKAELPGALEKS